jgi:molybdate transport system ATP-binding protein
MNEAASSYNGAKPFISLDNISLRTSGGEPSGRVCWEILSDQQWAVVGPNGSGKSSLMKAMYGQVPAAGGKIAYHFLQNGASQSRGWRGALPRDEIAYLSFDSQGIVLGHDNSFHQARWNSGVGQPTWSVSEILSERHVRRINPYQIVEEQPDPAEFKAQWAKVVEHLGLDALLTREVGQISNGERRKVLLARALLRSPQLLILDNPFSGLDAGFRSRLKEIISSLMVDEMRIILVMNDRDEIPPGITHILLLKDREVIAQGPRDLILKRFPGHWVGEREQPAPSRLPVGEAQADQSRADQSRADRSREPEDGVTRGRVLVQMDNVSVSYDGIRILQGINWTVQEGENWALLGPNGAGKTTLLSLILGDNPHAYANKITLFGKRRGSGESIWDIKQQIGWIAPELHLYYPKNVACSDVVCSGFFSTIGRHRRCSAQQRETVAWWLQRLGLSQYAGLTLGELSEGEQRMILIARALVKSPRLLVLDEPCQGLDASNRDRVLRMVEVIGNTLETSIIYVTHHRDALPSVITHVLRLDEGKVVGREKSG